MSVGNDLNCSRQHTTIRRIINPNDLKRLLNLKEIPKPADSADALALAICHIWRGGANLKIKSAVIAEKKRLAALK